MFEPPEEPSAVAELVAATPSNERALDSGRARAKMRKKAWPRGCRHRGRENKRSSDAPQLALKKLTDFDLFYCPRQDQVRGYHRSRKTKFTNKLINAIEDLDNGATKNEFVKHTGLSIFQAPRLPWGPRVPAATCSTICASGPISSDTLDKIRYEYH